MTPCDDIEELAYLDTLGMWDAALGAAVGYLTTLNVSSQIIDHIARHNTAPLFRLAAQTVLYQRGKRWDAPPCGCTNSDALGQIDGPPDSGTS